MLVILLLGLLCAIFLVATPGGPIKLIGGALLLAVTLFCWKGLFTLEPNQAVVMIFFGSYVGTVCESGFFRWIRFIVEQRYRCASITGIRRFWKWTMSAAIRVRLPRWLPGGCKILHAQFLMLKVHRTICQTQSESAVCQWRYRRRAQKEPTYGPGCYAELLHESIQQHVDVAGIAVEEAKIAHLAYAPEIANAMLRRQQAEAVVMAHVRNSLMAQWAWLK